MHEEKKTGKNKNVPYSDYYSSILSFARTHMLKEEEMSVKR